MKPLNRILNLRLWSLSVKEFHQLRRNRRLVIMLVIPPTLNIILFGLALNPTFENLRLGVVDFEPHRGKPRTGVGVYGRVGVSEQGLLRGAG